MNPANKRTLFFVVIAFIISISILILIGFALPQKIIIPVTGATPSSWNPKSFWSYPWGKSVVHKGIDIFAREGTEVVSATPGLVIFEGSIEMGGNVVAILGPKWRIHYYAHLSEIKTDRMKLVRKGESIGTVGATGNARGKPPHLHYAIFSPFPYFWKADRSIMGWKKMFVLDPLDYLDKS